MATRFFDWRDLPRFLATRSNVLFLYNELSLTSGGIRLIETIFSNMVPSARSLTLVSSDSGRAWFGQVVHQPGSEYAYLSYLAPANRLGEAPQTDGALLELLDDLAALTGGRGALRLLAEVEEHSPVTDLLHQVGFSVYTRQRVWRIAAVPGDGRSPFTGHAWRAVTWADGLPIQALVSSLIPGLVQKIEPSYGEKPCGIVCYQEGELAAYVEIHNGLKGIFAWPFVHPDAEDLSQELGTIIYQLTGATPQRPVYVNISHYQSWLENALEESGAQPGSPQVLMAKYLAARQKLIPAFGLPALEGSPAKPIVFSAHGERIYETPSHH